MIHYEVLSDVYYLKFIADFLNAISFEEWTNDEVL